MNKDIKIIKRVNAWKKEMRKKYAIPGEYEICMNYSHGGLDNNIEGYIQHCGEVDKLLLKKSDESLWWFEKGKIHPVITREQYIYNIKSNIKNNANFEQKHSDLFAHFIQIVDILQNSTWNKSQCTHQYNMNKDGLSRGDMPTLEQTVFALTYIRQLISNKDRLFNKACDNYMRFIDSSDKIHYIKQLKDGFNKYLREKPMHISLLNYVKDNLELIDTFLYGALIIHGTNNVSIKHRERFKQLYMDEKNKEQYIFALNITLKHILSMASEIGVFIHKDFSRWINENLIPKPDVFWQKTMFTWLPLQKKGENF